MELKINKDGSVVIDFKSAIIITDQLSLFHENIELHNVDFIVDTKIPDFNKLKEYVSQPEKESDAVEFLTWLQIGSEHNEDAINIVKEKNKQLYDLFTQQKKK